jgi:predicted phosphoribosyltransferase
MHAFSAAQQPLFRDRIDAGGQLAERLEEFRDRDTIILGVPRGGVPVAAEIARQLGADLDIVVARKVGAPRQPELAMGAVTADGTRIVNHWIVRELGVTDEQLEIAFIHTAAEVQQRERALRDDRYPRVLQGRTVIVVDDGLATGATLRAAVQSVRNHHPAHLVAAVPVGAHEACLALHAEADELVCLHQPGPFGAVGFYYREFPAITDDEVRRLLEATYAARHGRPAA